ncbi:MAG: hypothetical protein Ct9H90mP2_12540 [Dehalococcoidia bacterium]|nr:MAG: hypothetical protein Ct9H90mP2_12540 [Dehalococcoidia bacterium]
MMSKDSVKSRLSRDEGISFTEFFIPITSSLRFFYTYSKSITVLFQMGGSDQWGKHSLQE